VTRSGISSTIIDISQSVENMRYILEDDEWKKRQRLFFAGRVQDY